MFLKILFCLLPVSAFCQDTGKIDKIIFHYVKGHSSWNKTGVYSSEEILEFVPKKKYFVNESYINVTKSFQRKSDNSYDGKFFTDTISNAKIQKIAFNYTLVDNLIKELNTQNDTFTFSSLKDYFTPLSNKEVITLLKKINHINLLRGNKTSKIKKIQEMNLIDSFLRLNKPNLNIVTITFDAWDNLKIHFISEKDTVSYYFNFMSSLLGNPYEKFSNLDETMNKTFINLNTNKFLLNIMPKKLALWAALDFNSIKKKYLSWYFDNFLYWE